MRLFRAIDQPNLELSGGVEVILTTTSLSRRWTSVPSTGMAIAWVNAGRRTRTVERAEVNFMIIFLSTWCCYA